MWLCGQDRQTSRWLGWVVGVWIGFTITAAAKVLIQPTSHTVYPVFAEAARNWWQDRSLYQPCPDRDLYRYSPTFAVLMTPFAVWPHWLGGLVWLASNVVILLAVLDRSAGEIFPGIDSPERKALWLALTWVGSARSLWSGQSNSLILVMALLAMLALRRQRWWLASLLLAGGGFIKVWPWALALLAAACWPRQLIHRLAIGVLFWAAIPFLTKPPETVLWQYGQWFQMLQSTHTHRWGGYRDAWTIWELIQFPVPRDLYELLQCETALAVLAWCLWQRQQVTSQPREKTDCSSWSKGPALPPPMPSAAAKRPVDPLISSSLSPSPAPGVGRKISSLHSAEIPQQPLRPESGSQNPFVQEGQGAAQPSQLTSHPLPSPLPAEQLPAPCIGAQNLPKEECLGKPQDDPDRFLSGGAESSFFQDTERFGGASELVGPEAVFSGGGSEGFRRNSPEGFGRLAVALLGAWSAWQLLFGPGTERLTYNLIAPVAAWAVLASWQSGRYRPLAVAAWILISMFSMGAFERLLLPLTAWARALLPLGVVVFVIWLVLHETAPGPISRKSFVNGPVGAEQPQTK
ncbi:MAG: DUF2029 domain-containing protein [Thermoguttaceae bacterium]|nr:DUF2029 domain-containing protein [Thermoguttaceae bacterium]MDW8038565.1 glycosyltransferase family 87 protein [Thermoguttaceae bacterium]